VHPVVERDEAGLVVAGDGAGLVAQQGLELAGVRVADAPGGEAVSMVVPEMEIEADSATDAIAGRATPGGVLVLIVAFAVGWVIRAFRRNRSA